MRNTLLTLAAGVLLTSIHPSAAEPPSSERDPVRRWLKQLHDGDTLARQDAAEELGKLGPRAEAAIPDLIEAMEDHRLLRPAALALGRIGPKAVPGLIKAFAEATSLFSGLTTPEEEAAGDALARIGAPAVPKLILALRDERPNFRPKVAAVLGRIGPEAAEAIPALVAMMKEKDLKISLESVVVRPPNAADPGIKVPVVLIKSDSDCRESAASALAAIGPKAVPALAEALNDRGGTIQVSYAMIVVRSLWEMAPEFIEEFKDNFYPSFLHSLSQAPTLYEAATDQDRVTRGLAAVALGAMGADAEPALPDLVRALKDRNPEVRIAAAVSLGRFKRHARDAAPALLEAFKARGCLDLRPGFGDELGVRKAVFRALLEMGPEAERQLVEKGVPLLIEGLKDPDPEVRGGTIEALEVIGPGAKAACPHLVELLKTAGGQDESELVIIEPGVARRERKRLLASGGENVREILSALENIGKDSAPALLPLLKDGNPMTRSRAAKALSGSRRLVEPAVPDLLKALDDPYWPVRAAAAYALALARSDAPSVIGPLSKCLKDPAGWVRRAAAYALGHLGPKAKQAIPALQTALADEDSTVALEAAGALLKMGVNPKEPVTLCVRLVQSDDAYGRGQVQAVLKLLGPKDAESAPALRPLLNHEEVAVRLIAAEALAQFGPDEARAVVPSVLEWIRDREHGEKALDLLGRMGPAAAGAVPDLVEWLQHEKNVSLIAGDSPVWEICRVLRSVGPGAKAAVPALNELLREGVALLNRCSGHGS
jgi:HEAT repeat protein